jgi:uroporphyrinogen-III synthase
VTAAPAVEIAPLPLSAAGRRHLAALATYDGLLFTSANAVRAFAGLLERREKTRLQIPPDSPLSKGGKACENNLSAVGGLPSGVSVYAVGPRTAEAARAQGWAVGGTATEFRAEGLARLLGRSARGKRFLFPRAAAGRDVLVDALTRAGAAVDLWPVYRTRAVRLPAAVREKLLEGGFDAVTFTSSSTVDAVMGQIPAGRRKKIFSTTRAASIGPITSRTLRAHGLRPLEAREATVDDLVRRLAASKF